MHSIRMIANSFMFLNYLKREKTRFYGHQMLNFARERKEKYKLLKKGDDFMVAPQHRNSFIKDFFESLESGQTWMA